jgi:predicted DNA-binding transcriptional regulator AlpA
MPNRGPWRTVRRELRTVAEVCELAGVTRHTLQRWRARDFPEPVLSFRAKGGPCELWSRSQVLEWLEARPNWAAAHRLPRAR